MSPQQAPIVNISELVAQAGGLSPLEALAVADGYLDADGFFTMSDEAFSRIFWNQNETS